MEEYFGYLPQRMHHIFLSDDHPTWNPNCYQAEVWDFPVLNFNFQTCKLLCYRDKKEMLEKTGNPFGIVVLTHLSEIETRGDSQARYEMKFKLTRRLYQKDYGRDDIINLYNMIDWVLALPRELALKYKEKIHELEEEKQVRYITSIERLSREEGLQQGLKKGLLQGKKEKALAIAEKMAAKGLDKILIKEITGFSDEDLTDL